MKKLRILVVDDEPSVVDALKIILNDNGFDAVGAATARDAIELAARHKFDAAIVDLRLPEMSGLVALAAVRDRCPDVVGVLITALDTPQLRADATACGFAAILPKPFTPSTLLDVVNGVLSHRNRVAIDKSRDSESD